MFVTYQEVKWVSTLKITMNQKYITIRGKGPVVKDLKTCEKSKKIFLASDPTVKVKRLLGIYQKF